MEAEAQKTVALKKAYAEIILNTAKEAAARVMASERRALRFQQDLSATKDESLRMLVRLKQMIDSKTTEGEMTSLSQRRKIEELEAQLNEAEDVIADLRTELEQLWDELEKVKNNQRQPLNGRAMKEDAHKNVASEPVVPPPSTSGLETVATSDLKNAPLDQRVAANRCCNTTKETEQLSVSLLENYSSHNSDFDSIIMSSKEPELYRNGFTQRIRAFERTIQDGKVPSSGDVDDQYSLKKNELITKVIDKEDGKGSLPSTRTNHKEMVNSPGEEVKKPIKVRMLRRKRTRFGKAKATSRKCRPGQLMKPSQPSSGLLCCKKNGNVKSAKGAFALPFIKADCVNMISKYSVSDEKLQHKSSCHKEEVKVVHKGKGKRKMKSRDAAASLSSHPNQLSEPCQPSSILSRCRTLSYLVNSNVKSGEDRLEIIETEVNMKPVTCLDPGLTLIGSDVDPISGSTNLTMSIKAKAINNSGLAQNEVEMDTASLDESVLVKHEGDAAENLTIQSSELDLGMVNIPLMDSYSKQTKASEEMNGSPTQADNDGLLRYTFQRKRKKESSSNSDENTSVEESALKRRVGEKQSDAPEPQNSNLINESSRDSRRLIQVARQLISLSGKRW